MPASTPVNLWFSEQFSWLSGWVRETVITVLLVVMAFALARLVRGLWRRVLLPVARKTPTQLDITLLSATEVPLSRAVFYLALYVAAGRLAVEPPLAGSVFGRILDGVFFALVVAATSRLAVAAAGGLTRWYLAEVARRTRSPLDEQFVPIISKVLVLVIYFIGATVVLARFNINVTALVTTAGVASLAIALAAQATLSNMFAGFTIMIDRSYRVGDRIQLPDGTMGDVYDIGLRATKILSFDNELIIIPNREMVASRIINQTYPDLRVKVRIRVGVSYATDIDRAKQVLLETCLAHPKVLKDPAPGVYFTDFGDSSLNLLAICWVEDYRDRFSVQDELNTAVKKRFDEEGIEIPFPQRDLHLRDIPPELAGRVARAGAVPAGPAPPPGSPQG
ncbi:MAG TPA: mechanosensitive ion channel [Firmicutes bacterium]|nr:mechanosensitive ion channel [Bacillota bacterium]